VTDGDDELWPDPKSRWLRWLRRDQNRTAEQLKPLTDQMSAITNKAIVAWSKSRWWPEVRAENNKIGPNRILFFVVRIGEVFGAAAVPVFATAGTLTSGHAWGWVTVGVSLLVALLLAFDRVYRPGPRWRVAYESYHQLVDAAWSYLEPQIQTSAANEGSDVKFMQTVEQIIANQQRNYLQDIANLNTTPGVADGTTASSQVPGSVPDPNAD